MNLKEIYESKVDVRDSDIPDVWRESWNNFIMGSTCMMGEKLDGSGEKEFIYYSHDFRMWYHQNQKVIERDIKIDQVYE